MGVEEMKGVVSRWGYGSGASKCEWDTICLMGLGLEPGVFDQVES